MCGICGIWNFDGRPVEREVLLSMQGTLRHRGPDDEGSYIDGNVGLGNRRLSIIDLATGQQPMSNEDGTVWITYNGEVYNFPELRRELEGRGHSFRSHSDTEVIVHLYEEMGPRCVERLRGMFAFAIWDSRKRRMTLARDRLGLKPLYYSLNKKRLLFSSELKAILATGEAQRDIDLNALDAYLTRDYIPSPYTIYRGVRKLPPAHILVCDEGSHRVERYWTLDTSKRPHDGRLSKIEDYSEELESLLRESVRLRMVSDVPIGVLLSGGVDSSTVVAMMAQVTDQPIKTFSIGNTAEDFNELPYARLVAQQFGTDHHEFIVDPDAIQILPDLVAGYDEPFADSSAIPTYYVSKIAREHVKVCLAGDGGDELFAGYPWYQIMAREEWIYRIPSWFRRGLLHPMYKVWPDVWRGKDRLFMLTRRDRAERYASTKMRFSPRERRRLLTSALQEAMRGLNHFDVVLHYARKADSLDYVSAMQYADLMTYLPEDLLVKVDRASMMHGLEVRLPLLDHKLVEFVATIPSELKVVNGESKYILKELISRWVPREAIYRPKMGFGIPLQHWFRDELFKFTKEILLDNQTRRRGFFQVDYIANLLEAHRSGRTNPTVSTHQIWNLLVFEIWCRTFLDKTEHVLGSDN